MPEPLLRAQDLYKSFGRRKVLQGVNFAITLIVGFMIFTSTRKNTQFDRRLVLSGYSQILLILAKLTALVAVAAVVSLYTSIVLLAFWQPSSLLVVWLGFFGSAFCYGALGLLIGVLVRGELEGFFLIIMISLIDTSLQNPIGNPVGNQGFLKWFPSYAPMQFSVAGAFGQGIPWDFLLISLAWPAGFVLLGLVVFVWKTHIRSMHMLPTIESKKALPGNLS